MSDEIAVNYTQLAAAEADLSASVRAIRAALDTLNSDLQPLFASWQGDGGEAYTIQQKNWETASADLNLTLGKVQVEVATPTPCTSSPTARSPRPGTADRVPCLVRRGEGRPATAGPFHVGKVVRDGAGVPFVRQRGLLRVAGGAPDRDPLSAAAGHPAAGRGHRRAASCGRRREPRGDAWVRRLEPVVAACANHRASLDLRYVGDGRESGAVVLFDDRPTCWLISCTGPTGRATEVPPDRAVAALVELLPPRRGAEFTPVTSAGQGS